MQIDSIIKEKLGFRKDESSDVIMAAVRAKKSASCKPCWDLKYCPYGELVEEYPLFPPLREKAIAHNEYLKECLRTKLAGGRKLDEAREAQFSERVRTFDPENFPTAIDPEIRELSCTVFGHLCPVYFIAEPVSVSETTAKGTDHSIPIEIKMSVVRRDDYTCQHCGKYLPDNEVGFEFIVPVSDGGSLEVDKVRLICSDCNGGKENKVEM